MEEAQLATWPSGLRHFAQDGSRSTVCCFFRVAGSWCRRCANGCLSTDAECRGMRPASAVGHEMAMRRCCAALASLLGQFLDHCRRKMGFLCRRRTKNWRSADDKCRHRRQTARYCPCADVKSPAIVVTEPSCDSLTAAAGRKRPKSCARCGLTPRIRPPPARDRCRESNRPYPPDPRPDGRSRGGTQAGTGTGARHPHRGTRSAISHGRARRQT